MNSRSSDPVVISGDGMSIDDIARVAAGAPVRLSDDPAVRRRVRASAETIARAVAADRPVYGVTTLFGGMADRVVAKETAAELQNNLIWSHKAATGERLPVADVRAAMLLRANALMRGVSGVRLEIIERFQTFLNAGVTPNVCEFGSIGASGDLVPLAYIAGAITGRDARYTVDFAGEELDALTALDRLGLEPLPLLAKEGLALINGTSVCTAVAANCVARMRSLLDLTLATHALFLQALGATNQSFHPFVHAHKPHAGQQRAAAEMLALLSGSRLIEDELDGRRNHRAGHLIQDRYSVRCLPQFLGPIVDAIDQIGRQVEVEANSATDNPLIDAPNDAIYHCGNFLAQYIGVAMDQLRYHVGMLAKHMDVQIALLVSPEFNLGLPASLVGNEQRRVNVGLKPLQLTANSIAPMLSYLGNSIADRFPTHAEQFNQNINSQALGSANLTRRSVDVFEQYLAVALLFAVQAVDLRTFVSEAHYDARRVLSPATLPLYDAVLRATGVGAAADRPFVFDDHEQFLDERIAGVLHDLRDAGSIAAAVARETEIELPVAEEAIP